MNTRTKATIVTGPAGSGKTHRCITEICSALQSEPAGPPLVFITPKQATFQLERQILAAHQIPGYTRLSIVSLERLAEYILSALGQAPCPVLSDQGQIMVLRAILHQQAPSLRIFHSTARLPGFALELSETLRELQQHGLLPKQLRSIAEGLTGQPRLQNKLEDLAMLFGAYTDWLQDHHLHDVGSLLDLATNALRVSSNTINAHTTPKPRWAGLWLDGFAELSPQQIELVATLLPLCEKATLAFCAESASAELPTWNSTWCIVGRTVRTLISRLEQIPNISLTTETLPRQPHAGRFSASPELALLEMSWESADRTRPKLEAVPLANPTPQSETPTQGPGRSNLSEHQRPSVPIRIIRCSTQQFEATVAAREILRHVREHGGRFRDTAVLVRSLTTHADVIRRVFAHYQIPFFLDRRESVSHHPLVELTRSALRTIAFGWQHHVWMSVLKTELLPANDEGI
ncbi:MAG: PD-(D/E)XK nuclease family protein, partial [Verrucomicrobiia bacterium]